MATMVAAAGGRVVAATVHDALGRPVVAEYGVLESGGQRWA